jgi:hypothetical protein
MKLLLTPQGWATGGTWTPQDVEQETLDGYRWFEASGSYFRHFRPMPPNPELDGYWAAHRESWRQWNNRSFEDSVRAAKQKAPE